MIIAISGKMQSGKNTIALIIQYLIDQCGQVTLNGKPFGEPVGIKDCVEFIQSGKKLNYPDETFWKQVAFAGKLKQIVSILTGIPVKDLEKQEVKDRVLGEEWWFKHNNWIGEEELVNYARLENKTFKEYLSSDKHELISEDNGRKLYRMKYMDKKRTVRWLLQTVGTEAMRDIIHPNIWVNALFADYNAGHRDVDCSGGSERHKACYPDWIITDVRFPNELQAVKDKGGISIRVNRNLSCEVCKLTKTERRGKICYEITCPQGRENYQGNHPSETALDNAEFDYVIDNDGSIEDLVEKVREILIKENII
jgi:hypothetical protein